MIGLRGKIIGLFFIGFGLMAIVAIVLLNTNLQQGFVEIERQHAVAQMSQLALNLNSELNRLNQNNSDWGSWDDMYSFAQHPSVNFTERLIGPVALQTIGVKFILVLNNENNTLFSTAVNLKTGQAEPPSTFQTIFAHVKERMAQPNGERACGLDTSVEGPILVCWQPIHHTDHTGEKAGTLLMGRLMDANLIRQIQAESGVSFKLMPLAADANPPSIPPPTGIKPEAVEFSETIPNLLNAYLHNIVGEPILEVHLQFPKNVSQQGGEIIGKVMRVLLLVTFLTGLTLLAGLHFVVIRRLRTMDAELNSIWRNGRWTGRLNTRNSKDELNELARSINRMLALIRKQMGILESVAHTDSLTQIANRRSFDHRLAIEMSLHKRNQTPLALLMLDVDYFKRYNDYYGHPAGDDILKKIGKTLSQIACRPSDLPARVGGEEFAIILPSTDLEGARFVADKLIAHLAEQRIPHADSLVADRVTISIGVTAAGDESIASFIQRADKATYNAKQTGRNKVCALSPDQSENSPEVSSETPPTNQNTPG